MFNPLGALGSFGSGAVQGLGTGMDLMDKIQSLKGQANFVQSMGGVEGLSRMMQEAMTPSPGEPSQPPANVLGTAQAQAQQPIMPGAAPAPQAGMQPGPAVAPGMRPPQMASVGPTPGSGMIQAPPAMTRPQPMAPQQQPPPAIQPTAERGEAPKMTPEQIMRFMQTGIGPFSMPSMAARIEKSMPNASPLEKFYALKAGMKLMNSGGQQQFSQAMQLMQFMQRQQQHEDTLKQQERMEGHRVEAERLRDERYLRTLPYPQQQQQRAKDAQKTQTNVDLRMDKVQGHIDALTEVAKKVAITGNVTFDRWLRDAQAKLGWPDSTYQQYKTQLAMLQTEMGAMGAQTLGSLSVSAKEDGKQLAQGILTPSMLKSISEAVRIEGRITKAATKKIIDRANANFNSFMKSGGIIPDEPDEETTTPPPATTGATGATDDPLGLLGK